MCMRQACACACGTRTAQTNLLQRVPRGACVGEHLKIGAAEHGAAAVLGEQRGQ